MKTKYLFPIFSVLFILSSCSVVELSKTVDERVELVTKRVEKKHNLTANQKSKIAEINSYFLNEMNDLKENAPKEKAAMHGVKSAWETELVSILINSTD